MKPATTARRAGQRKDHIAMLKKIAISAAVFATAFLAGAGLSQFERAHAQDYAAIDARPALWSISDEASTVWMFGTVHILPPDLDWRDERIDAALDSAETVWFEAEVFSEEAQGEAAALIPQLGLNPPGVTLTSMISQQGRDHMTVIAERLGASPAALAASLDPLQPWLAGITLAVTQIQAGGYEAESGVDRVLHVSASQSGKDFGYFETLEQQLRFFADMPMEAQLANLEVSLKEMAEDPQVLSRLVRAWAAGDTDRLDELLNASLRDAPGDLYDVLIVERNEAWIPQILDILDSGQDAFIAVGAGHMTGEHGVVALLEARGLSVTRH